MRFMVFVKGDNNTEAGVLPPPEVFEAMGKYNEQLVKAGVLLAAEGLHPTSRGFRIEFSGKERTVRDGPFTESKELIAGFWLLQVKSREEAIEWVKRAPMDGGIELEVREIFEPEDLGEGFTPELREKEEKLRAQIEEQRDRGA